MGRSFRVLVAVRQLDSLVRVFYETYATNIVYIYIYIYMCSSKKVKSSCMYACTHNYPTLLQGRTCEVLGEMLITPELGIESEENVQ